jgi:hypothetical protein
MLARMTGGRGISLPPFTNPKPRVVQIVQPERVLKHARKAAAKQSPSWYLPLSAAEGRAAFVTLNAYLCISSSRSSSIHFRRVELGGSLAAGTATASSDLDLLV